MRYVVMTGPVTLRIRKNWRDEIDVAVDGKGGYRHRLEVSSNLVDWVQMTNGVASGSLLISEGASIRTNVTRRFFRAVAIAEDKEVFPETPVFVPEPKPPTYLIDRTLTLMFTHKDGGTFDGYEMRFISAETGFLDSGSEQFRYEWKPEERRLKVWAAWGEDEILLRPGTWWEYNGKFTSKFTGTGGSTTVEGQGTFRMTPDDWGYSNRYETA